MSKLAWMAGLSMLAVPLFAWPVGHGFHGVHSGPGLPLNSGTHVPFVGDQHWGGGRGSGIAGQRPYYGQRPYNGYGNRYGYGYGRNRFYPGLFAYPVYPLVSDWNSYAADPGAYYQDDSAPPPTDAYGPGPYPYGPGPEMGPYEPYSAPMAPAPVQTAQPETPQPPSPPLILVLHDGQKLQLTNYAVVDDTFWDFSKPIAHKIPVSSIDVPASEKATQEGGGEFPQFSAPDQTP